MNALQRPGLDEVMPFYQKYIDLSSSPDLLAAMEQAAVQTRQLTLHLPDHLADHRYAPGKWSITEVFQHLADCERIFQYRALRFARNDSTELPGFDEDRYATAAAEQQRRFPDVMAELELVRMSSLQLFRSFTPTMLMRRGIANGNPISVRAIGWTIAGHTQHHLHVIQERYLNHGHP